MVLLNAKVNFGSGSLLRKKKKNCQYSIFKISLKIRTNRILNWFSNFFYVKFVHCLYMMKNEC